MTAQIIRSQITDRGVEVEWSDGMLFVFALEDCDNPIQAVNQFPGRFYPKSRPEIVRLEAVSLTSARETLNGCGVQKVSR